ncbi:hypothetical protein A961_1787 [Enterococcus faecalis ATCC 29212]|nr:hypothetical protein A961_1787 [Enterococcus faecalis ATCC 29212]OSH07578.1 hypothetical protein EFDM72_2590 [Enterococcus faecalis]OSH24097.1 hypothetical protein EFNM313_1610 [Enterococcus faecalis]OSH40754.1 hypothetical protein YM116_2360 [Enterococcus faecalis]
MLALLALYLGKVLTTTLVSHWSAGFLFAKNRLVIVKKLQ